jgi:DegV family protein with EDD domain
MRRVRIVTDATADIPTRLATELDIAVVPIQAHFWREEHQSEIGPLPEDFASQQGQVPWLDRDSRPPLARFVETYRRLLDKERNDSVVSIHSARSVPDLANLAWSASQMLPDPSRVEIVDTGQLSMGIGWVAIEAARQARLGTSQEQVGRTAKGLVPQVRMAAMIDDLEALRQGGQLKRFSAAVGSILKVKALANLRDGEAIIWDRARTRSEALKRLVDLVREWEPLVEIAVLHTGAEELGQYFMEAVHNLIPARKLPVLPAGPVLAGLVGRDALGVAAVAVAES